MQIESLSVFRSITYSLTICIAFLAQPLYSQDKLLMIRQLKEDGFSYYDFSGKLKFSTPPKHEPCLHHPLEPFSLDNFLIINNTHKVLPVNSTEGLYLISTVTGKMVTKFDQSLTYMPPPENGYLRGNVKYLGQTRQTTIAYYDLNGKKAFGNGVFWEGSKVIDGTAIVQILQPGVETYNQDGEWLLIDSKGNTIKNISTETGEKFYGVDDDDKDEWKLSVKGKSGHYRYVRPNGDIGSESFIPLPQRDPRISATVRYADSIAMRDRSFTGQWMMFPKSYFDDKGFFLTLPYHEISFQNLPALKDYKFKPIALQVNGKTAHPFRFVNPHHVLTVVIENATPVSFPLFDLHTMGLVKELEREPSTITEGLMIFYSRSAMTRQTVEKIIDMQGNLIYQAPADHRSFRTVAEALKHANEAQHLRLTNAGPGDLEGLEKLLNMETLELENYQDEMLPPNAFATLKKLKTLRLQKCMNLKSLPESFKQLSALKHLTIIDCKSVENALAFIPHWPLLETFKTDLPDARNMQMVYPKVKFESLPVLIEAPE